MSTAAIVPRLRMRPRDHANTLLTVICLAQFMVLLDISIVNVALPSMRTGCASAPPGCTDRAVDVLVALPASGRQGDG
jgi:hypothetical protein